MASKNFVAAAAALAAVLTTAAATPAFAQSAGNPASGTTTTRQTLNIQIDSPADASSFGGGSLAVNGRTSIGSLAGTGAAVYVLDISGSTRSPTGQDCNGDGTVDANDDINGDGIVGTTLDCETSGLGVLNRSIAGTDGVDAGIVTFADVATQLDVNPAVDGAQLFVAAGGDEDNNGMRDIEQALRPLRSDGNTNYDAALTALNASFATRPNGEQHVAFFLSDGSAGPTFTSGAGSPLSQTVAAGITVYTFAIGRDNGCGSTSALKAIADATGGTCTSVRNPSSLNTSLTFVKPAGIAGVEVAVDGGTATAATLDALGNWNAAVSAPGAGTHGIAATVNATDGTRVTARIAVQGATPGTDSTPDQFTFVDQTGAAPAALTVSAPITVRGIDVATMVSVSGGEYSVNGGAFTTQASMVLAGDTVAARVTASATASTTVSATVTIGTISDSFDVTTAAAPPPAPSGGSTSSGGGGAFDWVLLLPLLALFGLRRRSNAPVRIDLC